MPRFFFNLSAPGMSERDEDGIVFPDLEHAYLDACQAVLGMSFDMLRDHVDPSKYRFDIHDANGCPVLELPFTEVLRPSRKHAPQPLFAAEALDQSRQRNRELNDLISAQIAEAHATLQSVRLWMGRVQG